MGLTRAPDRGTSTEARRRCKPAPHIERSHCERSHGDATFGNLPWGSLLLWLRGLGSRGWGFRNEVEGNVATISAPFLAWWCPGPASSYIASYRPFLRWTGSLEWVITDARSRRTLESVDKPRQRHSCAAFWILWCLRRCSQELIDVAFIDQGYPGVDESGYGRGWIQTVVPSQGFERVVVEIIQRLETKERHGEGFL